jgi:hypothetical protein
MALSALWQRVPGKALLFLINLVSAVGLIFEGTAPSLHMVFWLI